MYDDILLINNVLARYSPTLKCLNLSNPLINITNDNFVRIIKFLYTHPCIEALGVSGKSLNDFTFEMICGLWRIVSLDASYNQMTSDSIENLCNMTKLKFLHLEGNVEIACESIIILLDSLSNLTLLSFSCTCEINHTQLFETYNNNNLTIYVNDELVLGEEKINEYRNVEFIFDKYTKI
jgi:hypothetical protein